MPRLLALAALPALLVGFEVGAQPQAGGSQAGAAGLHGTPDRRKVELRVGERLEFAVEAGGDAPVRWRLDGATVAAGPAWTFAPSAADVGRHVVAASATGARRRWEVRVRPPRLPRVVAASPSVDTVPADVDDDVVLRLEVRPGAPGETVRVLWTVDGEAAGEGDTLRWRVHEPASVRVRALALGSLGAAVGREWRIVGRLAPPTTTTTRPGAEPATAAVEPLGPLPPQRTQPSAAPADRAGEDRAEEEEPPAEDRPATPEREPGGRQAEPAPTPEPAPPVAPAAEEAPVSPPPPVEEPPPPPPLPPPSVDLASRSPDLQPAGADAEVRRFFERYAAAWRNRDVGELQRIGQVTSPSQAADLERYFAKVRDLDVEVNLIEVRSEGDRATVRFTRRDRFRDPTGRLVTQESPPIEKRVVRSADGLRFEPGGR